MTEAHATITRDPVYYVTAACFAVLTTALPALLGQPRFLPILQAIVLTVFLALPLHQRNPRGALRIVALWLPLQYVTLTVLTYLFRAQVENAIPNGFLIQGEIAAWFFAGAAYPAAFGATPLARLVEIAGVLLGGLASAGLVASWFIMRALNLAAYSTAILLAALETPSLILLTIPWWTLVRVAGYAGLLVVLAEPLLTYTWSPSHYWQRSRRLLLTSTGLLVAGILAELILPGLIAGLPSA